MNSNSRCSFNTNFTRSVVEMQTFYYTMHRPPGLYVSPTPMQRHVLEDQVELWWFREPRRSLLCYCASVALIVGLGLGGVGLLSTTTSLSGEWRLWVGTTLCLLALAVLLKQLLSSAIQDMNCVRSRHRIEQLRSGGRADPALILAVGLAVALCGAALVCAGAASGRGRDAGDMLGFGLALAAAGAAMALAVAAYGALVYLRRRRERRRRTAMRANRARRLGSQAARVFSISDRQMGQARREASSSRTSLL